ncbi:MAG: ATP-binding protein [Candidatus Omnitrophota bacterium]
MISEHKLNLSLKDIPQFTKNLVGELKPLDINKDILFDIRLVIEEALANAIKHGNKMDLTKNVFLKINASSKRIDIEIKDQGKGFDYKKLPLPTEKENLHKYSGRGVFLIRKLMTQVKFFDNGARIKMTKLLKK